MMRKAAATKTTRQMMPLMGNLSPGIGTKITLEGELSSRWEGGAGAHTSRGRGTSGELGKGGAAKRQVEGGTRQRFAWMSWQRAGSSVSTRPPRSGRSAFGHDAPHRSMSSASGSGEQKAKANSMEAKLRQLYMRVHPDLFSAHPEAKLVNTKSFQRLSEFLTTIKGDSAPQTSTQVFPILFYLKPEAKDGEDEDEMQGGEDGGGAAKEEAPLKKVEFTLRAGGTVRDRQRQLARLFAEVGLGSEIEFADVVPDGVRERTMRDREPSWDAGSIQQKIQGMAKQANEKRAELLKEMREVWARRHTLHLMHRVKVTTSRAATAYERSCLDKMLDGDVLEWIRRANEGEAMHCILSDRYGLDSSGGILLDHRGDTAQWCKHIASVKSSDISEKRRLISRVRDAEEAAAMSVGLSYIHGEGDIEATQDYLHLLLGVQSRREKAERPRGEAEGSTLMVRGSSEISKCYMEGMRGTLIAPLNTDAGHLVDFVIMHRHQAARLRRDFVHRQGMISDAMISARRALGASDLSRDESWPVTDEEVLVCMQRLIENAGQINPPEGLSPLMNGMAIRVGGKYDVAEDGAIVIPHDFEVTAWRGGH